MKKGLTILTAAVAAPALFSCYDKVQITDIQIQVVPYVFCNRLYKVGLTIEGKGIKSNPVKWTTSNSKAKVTNEGYFIYEGIPSGESEIVTITATAIQDTSKKATDTITVLNTTGITEEEFLKYAAKGDENRNKLVDTRPAFIGADFEEGDFITTSSGDKVVFDSSYTLEYAFQEPSTEWLYINKKGKSFKPKRIPEEEHLRNKFETTYKDYLSCFTVENNNYYGYYVYKPGGAESGEDLFVYTIFQTSSGLPVTHTYMEGDKQYDYLNLTPKL